jgi:hypothetical protein
MDADSITSNDRRPPACAGVVLCRQRMRGVHCTSNHVPTNEAHLDTLVSVVLH